MATLKGTPHAAPFVGGDACPPDTAQVPDVCTSCRQVDRWLERSITWAGAQTSRFKSILHTILRSHDEVLQSLCGFCANQTTPSCECFLQQYVTLGLPMRIATTKIGDPCLIYTQKVNLDVTCYVECMPGCIPCVTILAPDPNQQTCWWLECADLCSECEMLDLDPCNLPLHLEMMNRAYLARVGFFNRLGTASNIVEALTILFPGSIPQIVGHSFGHVYATLGRALTDDERTFLSYLKQFIPLGFGVKLDLVIPCT